MMKTPRVLFLLVGAWSLLVTCSVLHARVAYPQVTCQPEWHASASGKFRLFVDPTNPLGKGDAHYRMLEGEREVWKSTRHYTLHDVAVADDGSVAGWAYLSGRFSTGNCLLVLLAPDGSERRIEAHEQARRDWVCASDGLPACHGISLSRQSPYVVFGMECSRVRNDRQEEYAEWWVFDCATGSERARFRPDDKLDFPPDSMVIFSRPLFAVPGLDLLLSQSFWHVTNSHQKGRKISLFDLEGACVWSLELPYGSWDASPSSDEGSFAFVEKKTGAVRTYKVTRAGKAWTVQESIANGPVPTCEPSAPAPASHRGVFAGAPLDAVELRLIGEVRFQTDADEAEDDLDSIGDFVIDGDDRFGFIGRRAGGDAPRALIRVTPAGTIDKELPLELLELEEPRGTHAAWIDGDRWLVLAAGDWKTPSAKAWIADLERGAAQPIEQFAAAHVEHALASASGEFWVVTSQSMEFTIRDELAGFDAEGRRKWAQHNAYGNAVLGSSPEGIVRARTGEVVALINISNKLQFFDGTGALAKTIDLDESVGRKPNYLAGIASHGVEGFLLLDFNAPEPILHVDESGKLLHAWNPKYKDGREIEFAGRMACDSKGTIWVSDARSLIALDANGIEAKVLKCGKTRTSPRGIREVAYDSRGWCHVLSETQRSVHIYDEAGTAKHRWMLPHEEFGREDDPRQIAIDRSLQVHVGRKNYDRKPSTSYFRFDESGQSLEVRTMPYGLGGIGEAWHFRLGDDRIWVEVIDAVRLVAENGSALASIRRSERNRWFEDITTVAVAPNGSLAILGHDGLGLCYLSWYDAAGNPIGGWELPSRFHAFESAFDGRFFACANYQGGVVLVDTSTRTARYFEPIPRAADAKERMFFPHFPAAGGELWLFDGAELRTLKYELPK